MLRRSILAAALCAVAVWTGWSVQADDVKQQLDTQLRVQSETELTVRRLQTLIRVLDFYQADKSAQKQAMDEMARVLSDLSQDQMRDVIARLEVAAEAGATKLNPDQDQVVWAKHREILETLKDMIGRYDAVQTLDQAAERLDRFAKSQFDLHLSASQIARTRVELADPDLKGAERAAVERRILAGKNFDGGRLADAQKDMQKDVLLLMKQVLELKRKLSHEHKVRVDNMTAFASETKVIEKLVASILKFRATGTAEARAEEQTQGIALQAELAERYAQMAHLLRLPSDKLELLKSVRGKVVDAVGRQDAIVGATDAASELAKTEVAARSRELYDRQSWVWFDARVVELAVKAPAEVVAQMLADAQAEMNSGRIALAKYAPRDAVAPETAAKDKLVAALAEIDRLIAQLELEKRDPYAALLGFAERLDRLIAAQTATRDATSAIAGDPKTGSLPQTARMQREHSKETMGLLEMPIPSKDKIEPLLYKAESAMGGAVKELEAKNAAPAVPHQDRALAALKEARDLLTEKIAAVKKDNETLKPGDPKADPDAVKEATIRKATGETELQPDKINIPEARQLVQNAIDRTREAQNALPMGDMRPEVIPVPPQKVGEPKKDENVEQMANNGEPKKDKNGDPMAGNGDKKGDKGEPKSDPFAKAKEGAQDAGTAVAQARTQTPPTIQGPLDDAAKRLGDAQKNLANGKPGDAKGDLQKAEKELRGALQALDAVQKAMGQAPMGDPMAKATDPKMGQGDKPGPAGMKPGQPGTKPGEGKEPGKEPGMGKGPAEEKNIGQGSGDREADGKVANAKSKLTDLEGNGAFLHLPPRQRELITQSLNGNLPPEYAHSIQQYHINISRGRPAGSTTGR